MFKVKEKRLRSFISTFTGELSRTFSKPDIITIPLIQSRVKSELLTMTNSVNILNPQLEIPFYNEFENYQPLAEDDCAVNDGNEMLEKIPRIFPSSSLDAIPKKELIQLINKFYKSTSVNIKKVDVISVYQNVPYSSGIDFTFDSRGMCILGNLSKNNELYTIVVYRLPSQNENKVAVL